jgi:putative N6-adenine-specific DNA methylase
MYGTSSVSINYTHTQFMNLFSLQSRIIVTCSNRLSNYLQQEIADLGLVPVRIFKTGVELFGTMQDCIRLNLNLRCASQVLFSIKEFTAYDASDLYNALVKVEWEKIIPAEENFSITSNVTNETITNNLFANVKVKDAIADRFREKTGVRPNSGPELNGVVVHLYWK